MTTVADILGPPPQDDKHQDPTAIAKEVGIDPALFHALIKNESAGDPNAVSSAGAVGKGQVLPSTAKSPGYGLDPAQPHDLRFSARYLKKMIDLSGGDPIMGLRRYKQGPNGELNTPSADAYVTSITKDWKPKAEALLGPRPGEQSPLAQSPQALLGPPPQQQQPPDLTTPKALLRQAQQMQLPADKDPQNKGALDKLYSAGHALENSMRSMFGAPKLGENPEFDKLSAADSPFPDILPGAAGLYAAKNIAEGDNIIKGIVKGMVGMTSSTAAQASPVGKNILNVASTKSPLLQAGASAQRLGYEIAGLEGKAQAKMTELLQGLEKSKPANYQAIREEIAHAYENKGAIISPEARTFKENYLDPIAKETNAMYQELAKITGQKYKPVEDYYPRVLKGEEGGKGFFSPIDKPVSRGSKVFPTTPSELVDRTTGTVYNPATGEYGAWVKSGRSGDYQIWKDKSVVATTDKMENAILKDGAGGEWHTLPGTMKEIEQHTNLQYWKDPIADLSRANKDVYMALSNAQAVERLKVSPEFLSQAIPKGSKKAIPEGWRDAAEYNPGTHQLDGWHISPRLQEVMQDAYKEGLGDNPLGKLNRAMIGSLFFNPTAHILNVATHSWVEKGLVSQGSVAGATVGGIAGAMEDPDHPLRGAMQGAAVGAFGGSLIGSRNEIAALFGGIKAVATRDQNYMRFLKDGAGLMYPSRFTRDFYNQMLKATGTQEATPLARAMGFANPIEMVKSFYAGAGNTMWFANDVIMMQGYLSKERALIAHGMSGGAAELQAIKEIEKHVPNYRIPGRVGPEILDTLPGGAQARRGLSTMLQSKIIPAFGRYDYGRIASYSNMMKDLVSKDSTIGDRAQALNQIAALGFGAAVVYPELLDKFTQAVTGNPRASWQKYGPFTVPWALYDYLNPQDGHGKTWPGLVSSMLPMAPAFKIGTEIYTGRDVFTDKSLHLPQGAFNMLLSQVAPYDQYKAIADGRVTPKQWLEGQFGIKDPTATQTLKAQKFFEKVQKDEKRWQEKKK